MNKPDHLRETLTSALERRHPAYRTDGSLMHLVVLDLVCAASGRPGQAFEYTYTLVITVMDFPGDPAEVTVPLMLWIQRWQPQLVTAPTGKGCTLDIEYLEHGKVDILIRLPLTEVVRFTRRDDGGHDVETVPEPLPMFLEEGAPLHRVYLNGDLIAACDHNVA